MAHAYCHKAKCDYNTCINMQKRGINMQTEYITRVKLTASDGMWLTNGETYGKEIFLSQTDNPYNYREITEAEYEAIMAEQEKANEPI